MSWQMPTQRFIKPYHFIHTYITANPQELRDGTVMPAGTVCTAFRDEHFDVHLIFRVEKDGKVEREGIRIGKVGLLGFDPGFPNPKLRNLEYVTKVCNAVNTASYLWHYHGDEAAQKFLMLSFPGLARTYLPQFQINFTALEDEQARSLLLDKLIEAAKKAVAEDMDKLAAADMEAAAKALQPQEEANASNEGE